jgi:exopolysaccharide biosynthesis polyprenyl glycosylphosphotransferase
VNVHLRVDFIRTLVARTYPTELDGVPMLTFSSTPQDAAGLLVKRTLDVTVSAAGLVLLAPLMLLIALAVRLGSPGPAIFSQERVGLNGRPFRLHKFRSMYRDAERRKAALVHRNEVSGPVFKMERDPRITPLGRWLRKFSLDELPQLWNVLAGDMSLVGPRPPLSDEVARYERWQKRKLSMKPGITCLWQVNGRSSVPFEDWMRLDLEYIDNWSLALDAKILLRTIPAVVLARGAR